MTEPGRRPNANTITDDELDRLYSELAALKSAGSGYCPECGRGDCSPTADQWYEQQQRAEKAERAVDHLADRYRGAEAAIERVRALHAPVDYRGRKICGHCSGYADGSCDNGMYFYPCDTARALDVQP